MRSVKIHAMDSPLSCAKVVSKRMMCVFISVPLPCTEQVLGGK